ncbi:sigma-70 family RNA polymerase sigma factor [Paenibacillus hexagrammi]|uniref:Sigma-70 family RNA polymerase sigma factor n=1 Tax=Paenibacillus hexagrammi TaxID=2908839 RepID=A0ABY3SBX0_9BACL|nr:sigma-70 family RNA polymerase sigma factor [Paenibacillus sp. YPD9-1]
MLSGAGSAEDVEECVSDVFLAAWHSIESYEESRASFRTWLLVLSKYKALDLSRKLLRPGAELMMLRDVESTIQTQYSAEQHALSRESARELIEFVKMMGEPDRSLFWRRYFYYESLDELAMMFGLTKKAIESRLYRCRTALKQALGLADAEKRGINHGR